MPLVVGISVVAFILTATLALSPDDEEIRAEQDLMRGSGRPGMPRRCRCGVAAAPRAAGPAVSRTVQARRQAAAEQADRQLCRPLAPALPRPA